MDATVVDTSRSWWREPQLAVLVLIVSAIYFPRLTTLTIRGEESRRARVAVEILESGDWIVPRQQGQIYLSRPPFGSYPIALLGMLRGKVDMVAVRLPTVVAILLTSVLVFGYARTFLSSNGSLAAGIAFATMLQVMEIGRLAETEGVFTLLVASSLLLWHWGYTRGWPGWLTWSIGYSFAALAGLTKGPQGPVYFVAVVVVYLAMRKDWKALLGWPHAVGMFAGALVLGAWQLPYLLRTNLQSTLGIWTRNAAQRFEDNSDPQTLLAHLVLYPLEVLACMLPWSLLLLRYGDRKLLATLGPARKQAMFLLTAIVVTFPSVWLASTAKSRYYMPLYPCFAVLIGIVIDRCLAAAPASHLNIVWRRYAALVGTVLLAGSILIAVASWSKIDALAALAQPAVFAGVLVVAAAIALVIHVRANSPMQRPAISLVVMACLLGLASTGVMVNAYAKAAHDARPEIAALKQKLPAGEKLTSFDRIDHLFAYLYETPIAYHRVPKSADEVSPNIRYFAVDGGPKPKVDLPFRWEPITTIVLDRNKQAEPRRTVIIGRRLPDNDERHMHASRDAASRVK